MKTAKELMTMYMSRDDWKTLKLWVWANDFEDKATEWKDIFPPVKDDRRVFINTYYQVYEAIESLPDNPPSWVCCAINSAIGKERKMMNEIITRFN